MSSSDYVLWFVNNYASGTNICVYQDAANVIKSSLGNLDTLSWLVIGANSGSQVKFIWNTCYDFAWFDYDSTLTQQITPTTIPSQVGLSKNTFGYQFSAPVQASDGQLIIAMDGSIPSVSNVVAGIGMDGAGIFAVAASPNSKVEFAPKTDEQLAYWISAGYDGDVNEVIVVGNMNAPQKIVFPYGIFEMTAIYKADGTWIVSDGPPASKATAERSLVDIVIYSPATWNK